MMKCRDVWNLIEPFVDGELDQSDAEKVQKHLAECKRCAAEAAKLSKVVGELSSVVEEELPPFFRTRVLAELKEVDKEKGPRRSLKLAWAISSVSVVALAAVLIWVFVGGPSRETVVLVPPMPAQTALQPMLQVVSPVDNSAVSSTSIDIAVGIYPPAEGSEVRLLVDGRDVTSLAEVTESYVFYSPQSPLPEGQHLVTVEIRDATGQRAQEISWIFHAVNGGTDGGEQLRPL